MNSIAAIETHHLGRRFRSRLEARWATFFHTLGISFHYEPEAYRLNSGNYLPDFLIEKHRRFPRPIWFEVKPPGIEPESRLEELIELTKIRGSVISTIPDRDCSDEFKCLFPTPDGSPGCAHDESYYFCQCSKCGAIGFEYTGLANRVGCRCRTDRYYNAWTPEIQHASATALSQRFGT